MRELPELFLEPSQCSTPGAAFGSLRTQRGMLPVQSLDVESRIVGLRAGVTVRQLFRNEFEENLEATYVFPLPDRFAAQRFRMTVGDRVVEGSLKERGQARAEYVEAIADGHRAALAEEDRSGVFSVVVGNLPPGEAAMVEFELVGPLVPSDGEAEFRFPLVVAPRYIAGDPLRQSVGLGESPDTDKVPDASRISPPVLLPGMPNPISLRLEVLFDPAGLEAPQGGWSTGLRSSLHAIVLDEPGSEAGLLRIRLNPGERLDRDFVLRFPVATERMQTLLDVAKGTDDRPGVVALTIAPPAIREDSRPRARDIVFLLDRSGSMGGWKMSSARRAMGQMVEALLDQDRFAVCAFDHKLEHAPGCDSEGGWLIPANNTGRWQTLEWLSNVESRGGTEIELAIGHGLLVLNKSEPGRDRVVVLVTDGQVGAEDAILRRLGEIPTERRPRVLSLGVDSAVNAGFLRRIADLGGGSCELVESEDRLAQAIVNFQRLLGTPTLRDVRVEPVGFRWDEADRTPARIPDLFPDRPVMVFGRTTDDSDRVRLRVSGIDSANRPLSQEVSCRSTTDETLLPLWGRSMVRDLEDRYASARVPDDSLEKRIVDVSLETQVLSRFTAYVAIDRSEVVEGGRGRRIIQPVEQPSEWGAMRDGITGFVCRAPMPMVFGGTRIPPEDSPPALCAVSPEPLVDPFEPFTKVRDLLEHWLRQPETVPELDEIDRMHGLWIDLGPTKHDAEIRELLAAIRKIASSSEPASAYRQWLEDAERLIDTVFADEISDRSPSLRRRFST